MTNWSLVAPVLIDIIETAATEPGHEGRPRARFAGKRSWFLKPGISRDIILKVRSAGGAGAETRYDKIENVTREMLVGQELVVIEIRVEALRHNEDCLDWAWTTAAKIRTRLSRQSARDALTAVNAAIVRVGEARDISYANQDREVNAAMFEITMHAGYCDLNLDDIIDVFERAEVTSHLQDTDGTEMPIPINYTDAPMGKP